MKNIRILLISITLAFALIGTSYAEYPDSSTGTTNKQNALIVGTVDSGLLDYLSSRNIESNGQIGSLEDKDLLSEKSKNANIIIINGKIESLKEGKDIANCKNFINAKLDQRKKVLVINSSPKLIGSLFGVEGAEFNYVMVRKYNGSFLLEPLDLNANNFAQGQDGTQTNHEVPEEKLYTRIVDSINREKYPSVDRLMNTGRRLSSMDFDSNLPTHQVYKGYLYLNSSGTIGDTTQQYTNNITIEYTLLASYNPYKKYLRLVTMGAGMSPTSGKELNSDDDYDRGYFHNNVNITMTAQDSNVSLLSHSPSNINGQTSYTASSSVTVGVDISQNPGFNGSYEVGTSETSDISDFDIQNNSYGKTASWNYHLGMTRDDNFGVFRSPGALRKDQVKSLPNLAKYNLQPISVSVWEVDGNEQGTKKFEINWTVQYMKAWVTGNWTDFTRHWATKSYGFGWWNANPVSFNFSLVNP